MARFRLEPMRSCRPFRVCPVFVLPYSKWENWVVPVSTYFVRLVASFLSSPSSPFAMQAVRLARRAPIRANALRSMATATVHPAADVSHASSSRIAPIPLSNIEAQWEKMNSEEQISVHQQLEALQKKDWKELSIDEKKAGPSFADRHLAPFSHHCTRSLTSVSRVSLSNLTAYYVAFGPHGPRTPVSPPGQAFKVTIGLSLMIGVAGLMYFGVRAMGTFRLRTRSFTLINERNYLSSSPTKDYDEGMAGGIQREGHRAEDESYYWYVSLPLRVKAFDAKYFPLVQVLHQKATLERAS